MHLARQGEVAFAIAPLQTVEQALALFKEIDMQPDRRWAGGRKDSVKYCTAFGRFRGGLLRELISRAARVGEVRAMAELEEERQITKATKRHSQLQILANKYYKAWRSKND